MLRTTFSPFILFTILSMITGGLYPLTVTFLGQNLFPKQSRGSLVMANGRPIGSELVGQSFERDEYFWGRPSAAGYNAAASTGSNLGPTNPALLVAVKERVERLQRTGSGPVPVDLVTSSASGLDPHITPAAGYYQVGRVAEARGMPEEIVRSLVTSSIEERTFGILGERRVNVLRLNQLLDAEANKRP